ncbi:unnamed protein product [Paramecium pentaurelia]|uniref:non-specific serine/threonine protein kinase n=1 Tax=Paramecium pentaurelia TaxID=43138 RepID=A0A8S1YB99_9CILI|nr:unnamed protein product [Paramecium pentaurelia]
MNPDMPVHVQNLKLEDFDIIKPLGKGAYSEVVLAKNKLTGHESALKIVDKNFLFKEKKMHHACIEREVLSNLRHKGIIKLFNAFEEYDKLYYSLEVLTDGNLLEYMNRHNFNDSIIKFYAAELLLILEYLHQNGLVHRDVKPENILLTKDKHLKLIDFGTVFVYDHNKIDIGNKLEDIRIQYQKQRSPSLNDFEKPQIKYCRDSSFVGTSEYLCPELIDYNVIGPQADLWALGCFIYQLYTNKTPFYSENEFELFNNISQCSWLQDQSIPNDALDLIKILLDKDPQKRFYGEFNDSQYNYDNLKQHPFFRGINFKQMWLQDVPFLNTTNTHKRKMSRVQTTFIENNLTSRDKYDIRGISVTKHKADQIIIQGQLDKEHGVLFMTQFSLRHASIVCQDGITNFIYINPQLNNKKTVIPLNQFTSCKLLGKGKFIVGDRNKKKYIFKQKENNVPAQQWVNLINKYIKSNHY